MFKRFKIFKFVLIGLFILNALTLGASEPLNPEIAKLLPLISPSKENYLIETFPKSPLLLKLMPSPFLPETFNLQSLPTPNQILGEQDLKAYDALITQLQRDDDEDKSNSVVKMQRQFLIGDLMTETAVHSIEGDWANPGRIIDGRKYLAHLIEKYPSSPYTARASYHLAMILLAQKEYADFFNLAHRQVTYLSQKPDNLDLANAFRILIQEAYYQRGQLGRAESYVWQQAFQLTREQLPRDMSLRYADTLFWQGKYNEVNEWYGQMGEILEPPDSETAQLSRFYYAESLFQAGRCEEALSQYNFFIETYKGERRFPEIRLREIECELIKTNDIKKTIADLQPLLLTPKSIQTNWRQATGLAAELMSARLLALSQEHDATEVLMGKIEKRIKMNLPVWASEEMRYDLSILQWISHDRASAIQTLMDLKDEDRFMRNKSPWISWFAQAVSYFMAEEGPRYVRGHHEFDYLELANTFDTYLQNSSQKFEVMLWVSRAYLNRHLPLQATRLLQRVYFQEDLPPELANLYTLELTQAYADIKQDQLAEYAFKLIQEDLLTTNEDKQHYSLIKASMYRQEGHFAECTEDYKKVFQTPVTASKFLTFSLQGAICARKSKKIDDAENFITHFDDVDAILAERLKDPTNVPEIQMKGLFERINILKAKDDDIAAVRLFEKVTKALPDEKPPLETIFLMMDAYRNTKGADFALQTWQTYQNSYAELPEGFATIYSDTLDLFARADLIAE